jgi:putative addiction module CopG family antidote
MNVILKPKLKKFVETQVQAGRYESAEDVLSAGLTRLMQDGRESDFRPGELAKLVAEGEADFARNDVLTMNQLRRHFQRRAKNRA